MDLKNRKNLFGFTLIETIIILGIVGIIGGIASIAVVPAFRSQGLLSIATAQFLTDLRDAQQRSISQDQGQQWGVHLVAACNGSGSYYQVFSGSSFAAGTVARTVYLPNSVNFITPAQCTTQDIIFEKLTGNTTATSIIIGTINPTSSEYFSISSSGIATTSTTAPSLDISLSASPTFGSVLQGNSIQTNINASLLSGLPVSSNFSVSNLPQSTTASFSPVSCAPTCISIMTISTTGSTPNGTSIITVTITSGQLIRTTNYTLTVTNQTTPSAPTNVAASAGDGTVTLNWQPPVSNGGSAITNYQIYRGTVSGGEIFLTNAGNVLTYTDTGLANGATYYYKVAAQNAIGAGTKSSEVLATPAIPVVPPGAPANLTAVADDGQVTLNWQAPASNGGSVITNYKIYRGTTSGGETLLATVGNVLTYTNTGLTNGTTYYYKVSAVNSAGEGSLSGEASGAPLFISHIFVTSSLYNGNLGGLSGADTKCQNSAVAAGLSGTWKAWLSSSSVSASSRLYHDAGPYKLMDGTIVASNWSGLTSGALNASVSITESGGQAAGISVFTNTATNGSIDSTNNNFACLDWTNSSNFYSGRGGDKTRSDSGWTMSNPTECDLSAHLYCIKQLPPTAPDAPTLNRLAVERSRVPVYWSAPAYDGRSVITNYKIYRGTASGGETLLTTVSSSVFQYLDNSNVANGTTYYYKITAVNAVGEGAFSSELSATPIDAPAVFVTSNTYNGNLGGSAGADSKCQTAADGAVLGGAWKAWLSDSGTAASSRIINSSNGYILINGARIANNWADLTDGTIAVPINVNQNGVTASPAVWTNTIYNGSRTSTNSIYVCSNWTNSGFNIGYYGDAAWADFRWTSQGPGNGTYYFSYCNQNFALYCFEQPVAPSVPISLASTPGDQQATLNWQASVDDGGSAITNYKIYRGTSSGGETLLTTVGNVLTYVNSGLNPGVTYYYKVSAVNSAGESILSNEVNSATPTTVPSAPTNLVATPSDSQISLAWSAPVSNGGTAITNYKIYRGTTSGGETLLVTVGNVTAYTNTGLINNGTNYYYKVSAVNGVGESVLSSEANATTFNVPGTPANLTAAAGSGQITLNWQAPASNGGSAITNYKIYRGTISGGETLLTTIGNVLTYTNTGLTNGTTYYYKVSAVNSIGEGPLSSEVNATTFDLPGAPTLSRLAVMNSRVPIYWQAPASNGGSVITNYKIYRGTTSGGETLLTTVSGTPYQYLDNSNVINGTTYYYKVSAVNVMGESSLSNELNVRPINSPAVFLSASGFNGNLGGLSGADMKCQSSADNASLGGTWKAWLSDSLTSAASRLTHSAYGYHLVNGVQIANSWADLTDGSIAAPINVTEFAGGPISGLNYVWTNTLPNGSITGGVYASNACNDWTSTGGYPIVGMFGNSLATNGDWTAASNGFGSYNFDTCSDPFTEIYCFEQ